MLTAALSLLGWQFWSSTIHDTFAGLFTQIVTDGFANRDFSNYWLAGKLSLDGQQQLLFTQPTHQAALEDALGRDLPIRNWSYPPHYLLFLAPLGYLSYPAAYLVFTLAGLAFFVFSIRAFVVSHPQHCSIFPVEAALLLIPFALSQIAIGQNGFWFGGLMLLALAGREDRPWLTGLALAALTIKPQLGILFPFLMLIERRYLVIATTIVWAGVLVGVSVLLFGIESWSGYLNEAVAYQQVVMTEWKGLFLRMMPTLFAAFRTLQIDAGTALYLHLGMASLILVMTLFAMVRTKDSFKRALIMVCGTFLITPYAFTYDLGALLALVAMASVSGTKGEADLLRMFGFGLLFSMPLWMPVFLPHPLVDVPGIWMLIFIGPLSLFACFFSITRPPSASVRATINA